MSAETKKVLEMVAEGKISAEDGQKLLDKLNSGSPEPTQNSAPKSETAQPAPKSRFMHIEVTRPGQQPTNIRIPVGFARSASRIAGVLPPMVLKSTGINLDELSSATEAVLSDMGEIQIEKGEGKKVRIYCE